MTQPISRQRKAVSLISGGLDSMLATRAMLDQGIHVEGINFYTGFCVEGHTHAIRKQTQFDTINMIIANADDIHNQ